MLDVERVPGELLALGGTKLCMGGGVSAGIAGQSGRAMLFNPGGSGILITVTSLSWGVSGNTSMRWGMSTTALTRTTTEVFRDTRFFVPNNRPIGQIQIATSVALAAGTCQTRTIADSGQTFVDENGLAVLAPGTGYELGPTNNNISLNFCFEWRERVAERSELNL